MFSQPYLFAFSGCLAEQEAYSPYFLPRTDGMLDKVLLKQNKTNSGAENSLWSLPLYGLLNSFAFVKRTAGINPSLENQLSFF